MVKENSFPKLPTCVFAKPSMETETRLPFKAAVARQALTKTPLRGDRKAPSRFLRPLRAVLTKVLALSHVVFVSSLSEDDQGAVQTRSVEFFFFAEFLETGEGKLGTWNLGPPGRFDLARLRFRPQPRFLVGASCGAVCCLLMLDLSKTPLLERLWPWTPRTTFPPLSIDDA